MANIKISNLRPAGSELFSDSESYMKEMTEGELSGVLGGACNLGEGLGAAGVGGATLASLTVLGAPVGAVLGSGIYAVYCLS